MDDELPILDWEEVSRRVKLPGDLCEALGLHVSTLRWGKAKFATVSRAHARDLHVIENIELHLQDWILAGPDDSRLDNWNVLFFANDRMHIMTFGCDAHGSYNVVTVFGSTRLPYITRKMNQPGMTRRIRK